MQRLLCKKSRCVFIRSDRTLFLRLLGDSQTNHVHRQDRTNLATYISLNVGMFLAMVPERDTGLFDLKTEIQGVILRALLLRKVMNTVP